MPETPTTAPAPDPSRDQAREAMRAIILKWIGEQEGLPPAAASSEPPPAALPQSVPLQPQAAADRERAVHKALRRSPRPTAPTPVSPAQAPSLLTTHETMLLTTGTSRRPIWAWLYRALWLLVLLGTVGLGVGVYGYGWNDPLTNRLLRYVPLPYGFVRYHPIWYGSYRDEFAALEYFHRQQPTAALTPLTATDIENVLVRRAIASDLAWSYGLWVTNAEVERELASIAERAGSEEAVARTVAALWSISLDEYRQRVIRPYLLKQKLLDVLRQDPVMSYQLGGAQDLAALDAYLDRLRDSTAVWLWR